MLLEVTYFCLYYFSQLQFCITTCTSAAPSISEIRDCTRTVPGCGMLLLELAYDPGLRKNTETTAGSGRR